MSLFVKSNYFKFMSLFQDAFPPSKIHIIRSDIADGLVVPDRVVKLNKSFNFPLKFIRAFIGLKAYLYCEKAGIVTTDKLSVHRWCKFWCNSPAHVIQNSTVCMTIT